jgi:hypothetical protein
MARCEQVSVGVELLWWREHEWHTHADARHCLLLLGWGLRSSLHCTAAEHSVLDVPQVLQ